MPTRSLDTAQLHSLARVGAIARLKELSQEAAALRKVLAGLKKAEAPAHSPAPAVKATPAKRQKRKSHMSPEARKAAAERMRAYWAKKKGEQLAPETGSKKAEANAQPTTSPSAPAKSKKKAIKKAKRANKTA